MMPEDGAPFAVVTTHLDWPLPEGRKSAQIAALAEALSTLPDPLVLAGDMNATPWSYGFREFVASSRLTRHTRNLFTYPLLWYYLRAWRPVFPFLPLDHLMTRGDIGISDIKTGDAAGSDHLSIIAELHVPDLAPLTLRPAIMPVSAH
jgi:endonuclease/exonuclease/phosphatase (EEP) superfamily protein YafD